MFKMDELKLFSVVLAVITVVDGACDRQAVSVCLMKLSQISQSGMSDMEAICRLYSDFQACLSPLRGTCKDDVTWKGITQVESSYGMICVVQTGAFESTTSQPVNNEVCDRQAVSACLVKIPHIGRPVIHSGKKVCGKYSNVKSCLAPLRATCEDDFSWSIVNKIESTYGMICKDKSTAKDSNTSLPVIHDICDKPALSACLTKYFQIGLEGAPNIQLLCGAYNELRTCVLPLRAKCERDNIWDLVLTAEHNFGQLCTGTSTSMQACNRVSLMGCFQNLIGMSLNDIRVFPVTSQINALCRLGSQLEQCSKPVLEACKTSQDETDKEIVKSLNVINGLSGLYCGKHKSNFIKYAEECFDSGTYITGAQSCMKEQKMDSYGQSLPESREEKCMRMVSTINCTIQLTKEICGKNAFQFALSQKNDFLRISAPSCLTSVPDYKKNDNSASRTIPNPKLTAKENNSKQHTQADVFDLQAELLKAQLKDQSITTNNLKLTNKKLKLQIKLLKKMNENVTAVTSSKRFIGQMP